MYEPTPFFGISAPKHRINELEARVRHQSGDKLRESLFEALLDPYPPLRRKAAFAFKEHLTPEVSEQLIQFLRSDKEADQIIRDLSIAPNWLSARETDDFYSDITQECCLILRYSEAPDASTILVEMTKHPDEDVRYQALKSVYYQQLPTSKLRDIISEHLDDEDTEVSAIAAQIAADRELDEFFDRIVEQFHRGSGRTKFHFGLAAVELGNPRQLVEIETELLDEFLNRIQDDTTLSAASEALLKLGPDAAVEPLKNQLKSWFIHPLNRLKIASVLIDFGEREGIRYVEKSLNSWRKDVRGFALRLIGRKKLNQFREKLVDKAKSRDYHADTAVLALAEWQSFENKKRLEELAKEHPDEAIRDLAREQLQKLNPKDLT